MAMADATAPSPTNQPSAGRILPFGKYLLLQRVSVGGMAEIFKAVPEGATRLDNILAIKRILPNIAEDAEFIGMFVDEARIAGQLTHPNICRIYELGKVGATNYIAMLTAENISDENAELDVERFELVDESTGMTYPRLAPTSGMGAGFGMLENTELKPGRKLQGRVYFKTAPGEARSKELTLFFGEQRIEFRNQGFLTDEELEESNVFRD